MASARSIGSASIGFGLVSIPVKLYSAADRSEEVHFNIVHSKDCPTKLKQQYVCPADGRVVPYAEQHRGYEISDGKFVVFDKEELKALDEKGDSSIVIKQFVPLNDVDRRYVERTYYLGPDTGSKKTNKAANKSYALLAKVLQESKRAAIGMYAARGKGHIVSIRSRDGLYLIMEQLYFADEVRRTEDVVDMPTEQVDPAELQLAHQLVNALKSDAFEPEQYKDVVRERVMAAIEQKIATGQPIHQDEQRNEQAAVDLVSALTASLRQSQPEHAHTR